MFDNFTKRVLHWMDGSVFLRAFDTFLSSLARICSGSYIVGFFTADFDDASIERSRFVKTIRYLLNRPNRIVNPPEHLPRTISGAASGSFFARRSLEAIGIMVPAPFPAGAGLIQKITALAGFAFTSAPSVLVFAAAALAPFIPTMALAALIALAALSALFTKRIEPDLTSVFILLYILYTLLSGFASFAPSYSVPIALLSSVLMFSYLLVVACLERREQIEAMCLGMITSAAGAGFVGLYQFLIKRVDTTWVDVDLFGDIQFRVLSTFSNPNVYGVYLLLMIPLSAALVYYAKKPLVKIYALFVTCLLLVNLFLSYSRGCMLALAVSVLVFVLLTEKRLVAALPFGALALYFILPSTVISRLQSITDMSDTSTQFRLYIWQGALRMLKDFWPAGLGQGGEAFNMAFPVYAFNAIVAPHSHNVFLQIFIELGVAGFLLFLCVLACSFRTSSAARRAASAARDKVFVSALIASVAGFLFQGIFDHVFYNYRVTAVFFLFLGICGAFARMIKNEREPFKETRASLNE